MKNGASKEKAESQAKSALHNNTGHHATGVNKNCCIFGSKHAPRGPFLQPPTKGLMGTYTAAVV